MGTTMDKALHLVNVKDDLKAAFVEQGQNPTDVIATYPDIVRNMGSSEGLTEVLDEQTIVADELLELAQRKYFETLNTGAYVWETYDKDSLEFIGYTVGGTEDAYPTAGIIDDKLYVRHFYSIEELTWDQIHDIVHSGYADSLLTLKDSKIVTLTTGEVIELEIIGFNHDTYTEGGKAPVSFFMKNCLNTERAMDGSYTNVGGWDSTDMFTWLQNTVYEQLPDDLKSLVKPVNKISSEGGSSKTLETISAKIWQLSATEAFSSVGTGYSPGGEGKLYPVFTDNTSRIKMVNGKAYAWWLRSPYANDSTDFCYVDSSGVIGHHVSHSTRYTPVGLCI